MFYLCLELGGTNLRYGVVSERLELLDFKTTSTECLAKARDKPEFLARLFRQALDAYSIKECRAISLSLASLMDKARTFVYSSPMVAGFDNIPLKGRLEDIFGVPVIMEKDTNILLLYELHKQKLSANGITAGFFLGTGIGNAMSIYGKIYVGSSGSACELGHIPVPGSSDKCDCGKAGCVETKACGRVFESIAKRKGCHIKKLFASHANDADVLEAIDYIACAIASEIGIIDPENVVLGGGLLEMDNFPRAALEEKILSNLRYPNPRSSVKFCYVSGDECAGVIGAALHALEMMPIAGQ